MRLATFNVENLFERAKAMNLGDWSMGAAILEDFKQLNELIQRDVYTQEIKSKLLAIMERHDGLLTKGEGTFIRLREIRGKLLVRPRNKPPEIAVSSRHEWIGWFELEKEPIKGKATENIARVIGLLETDILCIIEAEDRIGLNHFNREVLPFVEITPFNHVMLIDGNDTRGIDVGIMTKSPYEIIGMYSHIDDTDEKGTIFSRDCAEYEIKTALGNTLLLLVNHFKSKGYGSFVESAAKRLRQSRRVRDIYEARLTEGFDYIAVVGDLNAASNEAAMDPLVREGSTLTDIMTHTKFLGDGRPGTHGNGTASAKLDYILMSPKLADKVEKGGIERRGVWGGKHGTLFPHLPTIETENDAASDHAALWVNIAI
ncbi:Endonuclease/Exonuclease/phosphatase family [Legionella lansingensis]|uniref:Endonuclease/Exonuclease/phosphatase family protein n=2 Tax=Legionella lansingensis TaxID=45067 RepID=A0A0W0VHM2_9GAMM|nr:endonuclease/exonuclease/phosphatase family protein [Legionella lansingensis]KTD19602.1 Endonuclease/Exonuclease/phosphatase family protein [Legionella lansingensis]SNV50191.1 Endonuclease/Exonuclease/phosphatase family [Legionella lansingensis]